MKKVVFLPMIFLLLLLVTDVTKAADPNRFYNSPEDYKNNKPLEGVKIIEGSWRMVMGSESLEIEKDGKKERVKTKDLPSKWYTEDNGMLMRIDDGNVYFVVIEGPLCYYIRRVESRVSYDGPGKFYFSRLSREDHAARDYYSEGITGEIKKLKDSDLEGYLEKYNFTEEYKADKPKREKKDDVDDFITKGKNRIAKYILLVNEKMK